MNGSHRSSARVLFDALASLRLAVTVMVTLGVTSLAATIYESKHGTAAAQRDIYQTWWFAAILVALGINIFCAMMSRYPWKKHHTGFVMAHIGILTLLLGSLISLHYGFDGNMAVYEGETSNSVSLFQKIVAVELPDGTRPEPITFDFEKHRPRPDKPRRFPLKGTNVTLVADDFHPHTRQLQHFDKGTTGPPALRFVLEGPFGKQDSWLAADDSEKHAVDFGPASFAFHVDGGDHKHPAEGNHVAFSLAVDGRLYYTLHSTKAAPQRGEVAIDAPIATPWMGMKITVDQFFPKSRTRREVVGDTPPVKDERRQPAIRFRLEAAGAASEPEWLPWTTAMRVPFQGGAASVAYRPPELAVPFRVTLKDFNSDKYPGSNLPATYESFVTIDDPDRGRSQHHISMNHPLHYRGYIFFQSSFVEGQPMMSVFSVARAPGLPLVYLGTTLISFGVVWMFYVKPYLARRQAALALKAHREREARHDQQESVSRAPAPRPAGPIEPAGSGA